ncbi:MAG: pyridoxamine 5'-phosphate oxidase [Gemmatimonadota bacterium]|nr:pyridoxamine 5'-phosphate oxidase [Gemmatimonadota bacterium]
MPIDSIRRDYAKSTLSESDADANPLRQFSVWIEQALAAKLPEPNAMTLATASGDGAPSARMVLLRGFDERGFCFYTDYRSRKGRELTENPSAALVFHWPELERQVRITGSVERVSREESEEYFRSRPPGSRIAAWTSHQSSVIPNRDDLDSRYAELSAKFSAGDIPLPDYWGGFRVVAREIEFWQGRSSRLHDRLLYSRDEKGWKLARLSP